MYDGYSEGSFSGGFGLSSQTGSFGFGGMRKNPILSVAMHVVLWVTVLWGIVLWAFFFSFQSTTSIVWYDTPYWWLHAFATGVFFTALFDTMQIGMFLFRPSISATVLMALATITNIVAGYFYIIDLWIPCIFGTGSLDSLQTIMCDDERVELWVLWVGAWMSILLSVVGFLVALWDSATMLSSSPQFAGLSSGIRGIAKRAKRAAPQLLNEVRGRSSAAPVSAHIPSASHGGGAVFGGGEAPRHPPPPHQTYDNAMMYRVPNGGGV